MLQIMEAMNMELPIEMIVNMKWDVISAEGDSFTTEQSISRMRMKMDVPMMGNVDIDTDKGRQGLDDMAGMMAGPLFDMIGEKFVLVMNNRGEVTKLEVPESLQGSGDMTNPASQMFSADSLKQMSSMVIFPEGPVAVGDSWKKEDTVESFIGKMKMANTLTYKGTESVDGKSLHRIDVDTKIDIEPVENEMGLMGFSMDITSASGKSTIYFDNAAGCVVKQNGSQDMDMSIDAGGQQMNMSMKQQISVTFKKLN